MSLKLFTTSNYDEKAYTPLGFVRGTMVHAVSFFRDIIGNVTGIFGGVNSAINKKIDDTHDEAIQALIKYTTDKYPSATAITGISISLTEMREFIICVACGTALGPNANANANTNANISSVLVKPNVPVGGFSSYSKTKTKHRRTRTRTNTKRYSKRRT
jgi:uncharacterized protein YbjQ (UPF0145 family)